MAANGISTLAIASGTTLTKNANPPYSNTEIVPPYSAIWSVNYTGALGATNSVSYKLYVTSLGIGSALTLTSHQTGDYAVTAGNFLYDEYGNSLGIIKGNATIDNYMAKAAAVCGSLSNTIITAATYKGTWNAFSDTPTLTDGTGTLGDAYDVDTAGTSGEYPEYAQQDWRIYDGSVWQRVDKTTTTEWTIAPADAGLADKEARQIAKLGLAQTKRQGTFTRSNNGSILLDGTQYLTIPANSAYTLGTNDHTIEFWLYQSSRGQYDVAWTYCQVLQLVNNSYYLNVGSEGVCLLLGTTGGTEWGVSINPPTPSLNAWHHYAIVRYGNVFTLYIDGVGYSQTYDYNIPAQTGVMSLGKHVGMNSSGIPGYISNFRFVNGTAVYKQDFTPSEATLPNVPNTKILLNTVYGSNFLVDSSSIGATVTNVGNAVSSPQYPNAVVTVDTTASFYRARNQYDITQLPTQYSGNDVVDNPNTGGLVVGRPWTSVVNPAPVTQDLILFFDSERTDCYPGTGTTIYNLVDNTPSTLFGDVTYSTGILRIHNEDTTHPQNRLAGIECQTVTGFKTISLWYKQITSSEGYYSYIVDARTGMDGGWIYDTPSSDWFGGDWASGSMFINGGATQSPTYTQQLNVWRNVTFVTNDTAFTDNITLFSRFTREEGLDVEFGACMIYSRAITEAENKHNYDEFKTRYGL